MIADDTEHTSFSEHAQALAILTRRLGEDSLKRISAGLIDEPELHRTTVYFSHYLFEALRLLRRGDLIMKRLELWFGFSAQGFKTTPEMPEPSRSDCHAWAAHPIYHYTATFLGLRPAAPGFQQVSIEPLLDVLEWAEAIVPHPNGEIRVVARRQEETLNLEVALPEGITGTVTWNGVIRELRSGNSKVSMGAKAEAAR